MLEKRFENKNVTVYRLRLEGQAIHIRVYKGENYAAISVDLGATTFRFRKEDVDYFINNIHRRHFSYFAEDWDADMPVAITGGTETFMIRVRRHRLNYWLKRLMLWLIEIYSNGRLVNTMPEYYGTRDGLKKLVDCLLETVGVSRGVVQ